MYTEAYKEICESVASELGLNFIYTADEGVTSYESLDLLRNTVSGFESTNKRTSEQGKLDMMRAIADYQFGKGAGEILVPKMR